MSTPNLPDSEKVNASINGTPHTESYCLYISAKLFKHLLSLISSTPEGGFSVNAESMSGIEARLMPVICKVYQKLFPDLKIECLQGAIGVHRPKGLTMARIESAFMSQLGNLP